MNARVIFSYEHLSAPLELTVWVPKLPLQVELSDNNLSFIKGWRVPILPDRRSTRDSDADDEEDDRRVSRGCTLQYQRALVKVLTQFHTTSTEGTDQVITMLGPDWQVDVTDLVQDSLKVADPRIAELVDRTVLVGLELGSTMLKVLSDVVNCNISQQHVTAGRSPTSLMTPMVFDIAATLLWLAPMHTGTALVCLEGVPAEKSGLEAGAVGTNTAALDLEMVTPPDDPGVDTRTRPKAPFYHTTPNRANPWTQPSWTEVVESPLAVDAVLGESTFSVTDDKVSITELRVHAVSGLTLSLQPSPGNSHTMVAKATGLQTLTTPKQEASLSVWMLFSDNTAATLTYFDPKDYNLNASALDDKVVSVSQEPQQRWPVVVAEGEGSGDMVRVEMTICEACQKTKRKSIIASAAVYVKVRFGPEEDSEEEATTEGEIELAPVTRRPIIDPNISGRIYETSNEQPASVPIDYTNFPTISNQERPTESDEEDEDDFVHSPRNMTDLEIGMYALLGVFCLAILVFLINCIVFVLKYRHKRIPPEGQANMDHSHHWVFLGNGQPLRAQCDLSPQQVESPSNPLEGVQTCCHGDHHSSGSSQTSVQSQVHGRGDGSSGGSTKENGEEASSPTSKRKRVKFTTFTTLPTEELPYNSIPIADEEDIQWVCQDMGFQDPEELHDYMRRIKEIA
eukprot:superscaffoldBa00000017_g338